MSRRFLHLSRRTFLRSTAVGATASAALLQAPAVLRAQGAAVKVGVLHPVSGALSYSGQQGRLGATMAIDDINAAGGIKALGGAKIDPMLGDAQSTPDGGNAEVEKMNSAGVVGRRRRLCQRDLSGGEPDRGALRSALCGRCRRRRQHRHPRAEEHLPLWSGLRRHRQDRARQSGDDQRSGRQAGQDGDDRARGFRLRRRPRQAPQRATAGPRLPGIGNDPASDADPRIRKRGAQDQGAKPRSRHPGELL